MKKLNNSGIAAVPIVILIVVACVVGFAGYGLYQNTQDKSKTEENKIAQTEDSKVEEVKKGTVITTGDSEYGEMLFGGNGQAIYIWEVEKSSQPGCYGDCAEAWPPVLTDGAPSSSGNVNGDLLGTTQRSDGSTQVTYKNHPLYYYANEGPGEVKCHNVNLNGGLWWVIQPSGDRAD